MDNSQVRRTVYEADRPSPGKEGIQVCTEDIYKPWIYTISMIVANNACGFLCASPKPLKS